MSIVSLQKVTFVGLAEQKPQALSDLQDLGCLQIIPLTGEGDVGEAGGPTPQAREALRFLLSCPVKQHQVTRTGKFDAEAVETESLRLMERLRSLEDERDFLTARLRDLGPWGEFSFPPVEEMGGQRFWFYIVPHRLMPEVEASELHWDVVNRDNRFCYVVVVSEDEPDPGSMPVARTRTGDRPRSALEDRLEEVEVEIEDVQAGRYQLTRWCLQLARNLDGLEDRAARDYAATQTYDTDPLFALQAWAPEERLDELRAYATEHGHALEVHPPDPEELPPTRFANRKGLDVGEGLVTFYMTPSYWSWDPSSIVFISFAVFFAMILSDAGYGLLLALISLHFWKKLGQTEGGTKFRFLMMTLAIASIIYGVVVGSYFGVTPKSGPLAKLHVLDMNNLTLMMMISVVIGVGHVVTASIMDGVRYGRRPEAFPPFGWALIVTGGFLLIVGIMREIPSVKWAGIVMLAIGGLLVFLFTGVGEKPLKRMVKGAMAFTRVTGAFGDVLSYLRLFALGLATASLALAFNGMAGDIRDAVPGVGLFLALLVLVFGHALNLILGVASGVIHGMRLNVIEFFNWGVPDEGKLYRPFARKESATWNRSS